MEQIGQIQSAFDGEAAPGMKSAPQGTLFGEHTELHDSAPPTPAKAQLKAWRERLDRLAKGQRTLSI